MKKVNLSSTLIFRGLLIIFLQMACSYFVMAQNDAPDLVKEAGLLREMMETEAGDQFFAFPEAAVDGSNIDKIFLKRSFNNTLWSNERREECYTISILMAVQLPALMENNNSAVIDDQVTNIGSYIGFSSDFLNWLNDRQTNYRLDNGIINHLDNVINKYLRGINPKSSGGIQYEFANLKLISDVLQGFRIGTIAADFAAKAAIREALATDVAYSRLLYLDKVISQRNTSGHKVDPALRNALVGAKNTLLKSQDYYHALLTEIESRYDEVARYGTEIAIGICRKNIADVMFKTLGYNSSGIVGLWTWSLFWTWETIDGLLEQHEDMQVAITSATLSVILNEEKTIGTISDNAVFKAIRLHCDYGYYKFIIQLTKDPITWPRQLLDKIFFNRNYYKEARLYYEDLLNRLVASIFSLDLTTDIANNVKNGDINISFILDSSGSMKESDPQEIRKTSLKQIIEIVDNVDNLFLVDFDHEVRLINPDNFKNRNKSILFHSIDNINSDGGTNIGNAIEFTRKILEDKDAKENAGVLLLSDGMGDYYNEADWFAENNIPIYTISLLGEINEQLMSAIAINTGGEYFKAYNDYNVMEAFISFICRVQDLSILYSSKNQIVKDQSVSNLNDEFWIEPGIKEALISVFTSESNPSFNLIYPDGKHQLVSDMITSIAHGKNYIVYKLNNPIPGKYKIEIAADSWRLPAKYWALVTGKTNNKIDIEINQTQNQFVIKPLLRNNSSTIINSVEIEVMTPRGNRAILNRYTSDAQNYLPIEGAGTYRIEATINGLANAKFEFQRYITKSVFVDNNSAKTYPQIKEVNGSYLSIDQGKDNSLQEGSRCLIYKISERDETLCGRGNIIQVSENTSIVEIIETYGNESPANGDFVLVITPWSE